MRDAAARIAILGGTFDPIHNGHRALLHKAFQTASQVGPAPSHVIVGLTSPSLAAQTRQHQSHVEAIKPYDERKAQLRETLDAIGEAYAASVEIIELTDPREPAATDADIDALVVSPEASAQRRAHEINERRLKRELAPLEVHTAPFVVAEDGNRISSTRIRNGDIDVHGRLLSDTG